VKVVLMLVSCCVSIAAAFGQQQTGSVDQGQHVSADNSYVSDQQNPLNSQGLMELLRTDHRSVLRVDSRTAARVVGETQAVRRAAPLSSSGIVRANGETRLTSNRPWADVSNSVLTTALDSTDLPKPDSDAFPVRRPLPSALCCGVTPAHGGFGIVSPRSRHPTAATRPLEHHSYSMSALPDAAKPSPEGLYSMSALTEAIHGQRPGESKSSPEGFGEHFPTPSFFMRFKPQQADVLGQFAPSHGATWSPSWQR
jgi:hypothetical protein